MPVSLKGSTSGSVTIQAAAVAGVNTVTVPAETGTVITTASSAALPVTALSTTGTPSASTYLAGNGAWQSINTSPSGLLIRAPRILTSGTSYTTPSNCTAIYVEMLGGGGGGGGANGTNGTSSGGGGGGFLSKYLTVLSATAYTYAIGSGGSGGVGSNNGAAGGNTTLVVSGTTYTAGGGGGGGFADGNNTVAGAGGTGTNGDINLTGFSAADNTGSSVRRGAGPGGPFISQGPTNNGTGNGVSATSYGVGGGGSNTNAGGSTATGGNGFQGLIRIWEYT